MKQFIVYNSTGAILRTGRCMEGDLPLQAAPGEFVIEGVADPDKDIIDAETQTVVPLPPRPSKYHHFDYTIKEWALDLDAAWAGARAERNRLLTASDWTQLPDVPLETKEAWATYRQALRDITEQPDPLNIVWPEPPA